MVWGVIAQEGLCVCVCVCVCVDRGMEELCVLSAQSFL